MTAVEIGGGLSGLQFVINKTGVHYTNLDPFLDYGARTDIGRCRELFSQIK